MQYSLTLYSTSDHITVAETVVKDTFSIHQSLVVVLQSHWIDVLIMSSDSVLPFMLKVELRPNHFGIVLKNIILYYKYLFPIHSRVYFMCALLVISISDWLSRHASCDVLQLAIFLLYQN